MNYPSIRIEGAILSPDILDRLDESSVGQKASDFGFDSGTKVKDEIARAWADAQDYWRIFQRKLETVKEGNPATSETRQNWIIPLLGLLKYDLEFEKSGTEVAGKIYAISHRVTNRANTPIHIVGYLDEAGLDKKPANATLRMSAHALIQQYLNLKDELYGLVTNGRVIRLLRDSSRLVKQSYLEFDLDRIFNDGLYPDFAILFRLLHASRLPQTIETASESLIEKYHQDSLDSGARIREGLSHAVEDAILAFGNGFLANPANEGLRERVANGQLQPAEYYKSLLRLIYRLLFLMVIEERDLVFPEGASKKQRELYRNYYSVQRLRVMAEKRYLANKRNHDLWLGLLSTFKLFEADGPGEKIGLKPLAGDLFGAGALASFVNADYFCQLGNDVLLQSIRSLGLYEHPDTRQVIRVNYGALNVEEFGSVYEGLLEYEPAFDISGATPQFVFKEGDERSRTGSHYTPDELVQPLIKHSLDYLIEDKLKEPDKEKALLDLRVADIACGSGHILLAAARRIATELAVVRTGEEQPSPPAYRKALRDVIRNCIYGADINPLAVELCKVALWLEAHNPGEPLNFLDHHIKCGNAIVGYVTKDEVDKGVPEEAFVKMPGDDADFGKEIRRKNKVERAGQQTLNFTNDRRGEISRVLTRWSEISTMPERTPAEIEAKKLAFEQFSTSGAAYELEKIVSIPIAQFFIPKTPENSTKLITDAEFRDYWSGERRPQNQAFAAANAVSHEKRFFHWFLEFPDIIERGGFDCILGNPPYLGGKSISGKFGNGFCEYVKWHYLPAGISDLVVYFVRRMHTLLKKDGITAFITTSSIKDGDIRRDSLDPLIDQGSNIMFAVRSMRWAGRANVVVALLSIYKGPWRRNRFLDNNPVPYISSFLDDEESAGEPLLLSERNVEMYQGSVLVGDGFYLDDGDARQMVRNDPRNVEVIRLVVNGSELNNKPDQAPERWVICFDDFDQSRAQTYLEPFERIEQTVKDERAKLADTPRYKGAKEKWWQYVWPRPELYRRIRRLNSCLVATAHSKYLSFSSFQTSYVFTHAIFILATDRWDVFSLVSSNLHEVWARHYSGSLGATLRYSPTDCFRNFPAPSEVWNSESESFAQIGERYHEHRRELMLSLWLGLTKIYNLFHDPELSVETVQQTSGKDEDIARDGYNGLLELRRLHTEMDNAVRDAYGWQDLRLEHGFHEVETLPENDRTRYTISPTARKEVLKRLLALNHERAAAEKAAAAAKAKPKHGRKKKSQETGDGDNPLLSAGPLFETGG